MKTGLLRSGYINQKDFNVYFAVNKKAYGIWKARQPRKKLKGRQKKG